MQTKISTHYLNTVWGKQADEILRRCVHCGFCNATCPTYQLLGDELDGPRGRIYQIKQVLETQQASTTIQQHLDRCLSCLNCETTCPSGVKYGQLLDIGRQIVNDKVKRPFRERLLRVALANIVPHTGRTKFLLSGLKWFKYLFPQLARRYLPDTNRLAKPSTKIHARKVLLLDGCVQPALAPNINLTLINLLDKLDISTVQVKSAGCCGAVSHHLSQHRQAQLFMRNNIDAWWPYVEEGAEFIITTASACSLFLKDYERLLADDAKYAAKAQKISAMCRDISEVLNLDNLPFNCGAYSGKNVAFHSPCTLQHGLGITGKVEALLRHMGMNILPVKDAHICCGAAGTYSILQKQLSNSLRASKLHFLEQTEPDVIATANIGCLLQLRAATAIPVKHWVELLVE